MVNQRNGSNGKFSKKDFVVGANNRFNKEKYVAWIKKLMNQRVIKNKALNKINVAIQMAKNNPGNNEQDYEVDVMGSKGVIYAIIHLSSKLIYVGQTINSALQRFISHWNARNKKKGKKKKGS